MLLATGFPGGPWSLGEVMLLLAMVFGPFVVGGGFLLASGWTAVTRRGPARWGGVAALVVSIVWTLFGFVANERGVFGGLYYPAVIPLIATLVGAPLGFAAAYGVSRLLARRPREAAREAIDASWVALLPALLAWTTIRLLGVLPAEASPLLLVSPVLAMFGGLWAAAAAGLAWSRLSLLRREEARAERLQRASRPLSVVALSD